MCAKGSSRVLVLDVGVRWSVSKCSLTMCGNKNALGGMCVCFFFQKFCWIVLFECDCGERFIAHFFGVNLCHVRCGDGESFAPESSLSLIACITQKRRAIIDVPAIVVGFFLWIVRTPKTSKRNLKVIGIGCEKRNGQLHSYLVGSRIRYIT